MPRCKNCKDKFEQKAFNQKFCMKDECIEAFWVWYKLENEKKFKKQCSVERKQYYEKNKKISDYKSDARKVFQKWIRKRDEQLPCISCGCMTAKQWDGGHYLKAELFSGLIFNEQNCHKQCSVCNDFKSGNELEYRDGLIKRYGESYVFHIENTKNLYRVKKWTKEELIAIKEKYTDLLKNY